MTALELGQQSIAGALFIVGELRAMKADRAGYVDKKTGLAMQSIVCTYFVERCGSHGYEQVKVSHRAPAEVTDPSQVRFNAEKGKLYAFQVEHFERKPAGPVARMVGIEPFAIESDGAPADAPSGAAGGVPS
jgi:hypothetical protein